MCELLRDNLHELYTWVAKVGRGRHACAPAPALLVSPLNILAVSLCARRCVVGLAILLHNGTSWVDRASDLDGSRLPPFSRANPLRREARGKQPARNTFLPFPGSTAPSRVPQLPTFAYVVCVDGRGALPSEHPRQVALALRRQADRFRLLLFCGRSSLIVCPVSVVPRSRGRARHAVRSAHRRVVTRLHPR